tara:strand:+ start:62 stop:1312 length:1251 start_codon:yes stop_codon:yes gene_type:complete
MEDKIGVLGIGYVGLPLVVFFSQKYEVVAFDTNRERIDELKEGYDRNEQIKKGKLNNKRLLFTYSEVHLKKCNIFIITVPTPIFKNKTPDLRYISKASKLAGRFLSFNDVVIYESTVYPGATEEFCLPILEKISGLKVNKDFFIGYSPERINVGDNENRIDNISKIVSASNNKTLDKIHSLYKSVLSSKIYKVSSIKVAEACKITENVQRDVNIALINELAIVFNNLNIDTNEVLKAASTKWNFNKFQPGLVGGHCIGVDPYYLVHKSKSHGFKPEIISNARKLNEGMPAKICEFVKSKAKQHGLDPKNCSALIMGASFKENVKDVRNSKSIDLFKKLSLILNYVEIYDPIAEGINKREDFRICCKIQQNKKFDIIILSVAHEIFSKIDPLKLINKKGFVYDIKSFYKKHPKIYRL